MIMNFTHFQHSISLTLFFYLLLWDTLFYSNTNWYILCFQARVSTVLHHHCPLRDQIHVDHPHKTPVWKYLILGAHPHKTQGLKILLPRSILLTGGVDWVWMKIGEGGEEAQQCKYKEFNTKYQIWATCKVPLYNFNSHLFFFTFFFFFFSLCIQKEFLLIFKNIFTYWINL
jgi:hypothetical protein